MSSFRISFIQQLMLLSHLILTNAAVLIGFYCIFGSIYPTGGFIFLYFFMFLFSVLPTFFLHIQYFIKNRGAVLIINSESETLSYVQSNKSLQYSFSQIKSIEGIASYGKGSGWYSFGEYRYCQINFNDSSKIIITCLMVNDIENTFKKALKKEVEKRFRFLAVIR